MGDSMSECDSAPCEPRGVDNPSTRSDLRRCFSKASFSCFNRISCVFSCFLCEATAFRSALTAFWSARSAFFSVSNLRRKSCNSFLSFRSLLLLLEATDVASAALSLLMRDFFANFLLFRRLDDIWNRLRWSQAVSTHRPEQEAPKRALSCST